VTAEIPDAPEGWGEEQTSAVGYAIWDALTNDAEFTGADYSTQLADLIEWGGGKVRATARAMGVPYSTFRGWLHGVRPKATSRAAITVSHRNLIGGGAAELDRKAAGGATLKTRGTWLGGKSRNQSFYAGRESWDEAAERESGGVPREPVAKQLVDAYRAGASPYELGAVYGAAMAAAVPYMDELDIGEIDWFDFEDR
jgi:hypothetical protein